MDFHQAKAAISQKAILINAQNKILFLQRSKDDFTRPNGLDFPGGGLDEMEDPIDGIIREIKEETGIIAHNPEPILTKSFRLSDNCWTVMIVYILHIEANTVTISHEHQSFIWLTRQEALESSLPESYKKILQKITTIVDD